MKKTKNIQKTNKKDRKPEPKKVTDQEGNPLIQNLNDFVTAIKITHSSLPIYTGGRILATNTHLYATCNSQIAIYSFQEGAVIDRIKHTNQEIVNFCVCPQQKHIVTFTQNSLARVILLETKKVIHTVKLSGAFANDLAFSPDGKHFAFALGNCVHIFTFQTMKRTHTYNPTNSKFVITKLQWHPNPNSLQIVTADMQRNIAIFDYILNKVVSVSQSGEGGSDFCFTNSGNTIVALNNLEVKVYQAKGLKLKFKFETQSYMETICADEAMLYMGGEDTGLVTVDMSNNHDLKYRQNPGCTDNGVMKVMWKGKNSKQLLVVSVEQNITMAKTNGKEGVISEGMIVGYNDEIIDIKSDKRVEKGDMEIEEDKQYFVMVTNSNNVKLMNKKTHRLEKLIQGHENTVLCAQYWHPYIATAGKDKILKLWRIQEGTVRLLANYNGHNADIMGVAALPQNKVIATVSEDNTIKLWSMCLEADQKVQIKSALRTTIAHQKTINVVRVSPKQDMMATCSQDRTIKIWNLHLTNLMTLVGHKRGVWDVAFHPIQQLLVSVGGDGMIKGWNLQTGECTWSMGQGAALIRCQWIYYNQVVTGSLDGIVKIWDIRKQTSLSYDKHEGKIWALDVCKDSDKKAVVMSGATDSIYHVWHDNTNELKEDIMHKHQLEEQERIFYSQHMQDKNFTQAAIVAFKGNFLRLFLKVLEEMSVTFDPEAALTFQEENGEMVIETNNEEQKEVVTNEQFSEMVERLKEIDLSRLLVTIQQMNQTVRHYKMGHKLLREVLKTTKFSQLMELNRSFSLPSKGEDSLNEFNEKKSGLQKWLQNMVSSGIKHTSRVQRYIRGTYWIEYLHKQENPFIQ